MAQTQNYSKLRHQEGFTLIELMVTVAIVAIIAAVAIPNYRDYVIRSKIAEAASTLSDARVKMEQYYQDQRTYVGAPVCTTVPTGQYFTYDCPTLAANAYTIRARGIAAQGMTSFAYTIDQANNRVTTGVGTGWTLPSPSACWVTRKDGSC